MISSEGLKRIVRILSVGAWAVLGLATALSIFQLALPPLPGIPATQRGSTG